MRKQLWEYVREWHSEKGAVIAAAARLGLPYSCAWDFVDEEHVASLVDEVRSTAGSRDTAARAGFDVVDDLAARYARQGCKKPRASGLEAVRSPDAVRKDGSAKDGLAKRFVEALRTARFVELELRLAVASGQLPDGVVVAAEDPVALSDAREGSDPLHVVDVEDRLPQDVPLVVIVSGVRIELGPLPDLVGRALAVGGAEQAFDLLAAHLGKASDNAATWDQLERLADGDGAKRDDSMRRAVLEELLRESGEWGRLCRRLEARLEQSSSSSLREDVLLLAHAYTQPGVERFERAAGILWELLDKEPTESRAVDQLEDIYRRLGDWARLAPVLEAKAGLLSGAPSGANRERCVETWRELSKLAEERLNDKDLAITALEELLRLSPRDNVALVQKSRLKVSLARRSTSGVQERELRGPYAFVSYKRSDTERVDALLVELERIGVPLWIDRRGLTGGEGWEDDIAWALRRSTVVIALLTRDAVSSEFVRRETMHGFQQHLPVIPVLLDRLDEAWVEKHGPALLVRLHETQCIEAWDQPPAVIGLRVREAFDRLAESKGATGTVDASVSIVPENQRQSRPHSPRQSPDDSKRRPPAASPASAVQRSPGVTDRSYNPMDVRGNTWLVAPPGSPTMYASGPTAVDVRIVFQVTKDRVETENRRVEAIEWFDPPVEGQAFIPAIDGNGERARILARVSCFARGVVRYKTEDRRVVLVPHGGSQLQTDETPFAWLAVPHARELRDPQKHKVLRADDPYVPVWPIEFEA